MSGQPTPDTWVSVLVCSYNTSRQFLRECLLSIAQQRGPFGMELVWIDDGSNDEYTDALKEELTIFQRIAEKTRFVQVVYNKVEKTKGTIATCLNIGLALCHYDIVFRMDSDDIMLPDRIQKQLDFLQATPDCVICGSNVGFMYTNNNNNNNNNTIYEIRGQTKHPTYLTWSTFQATHPKPLWFMNHPTLCFKKAAVEEVGGYDESPDATDDWMLEIELMKRFVAVYNIPDILLYYRIHPSQVTYQGKFNTPARLAAKEAFLQRIL
jgi:glycosyltransferase involved in cell wall biosynthesis